MVCKVIVRAQEIPFGEGLSHDQRPDVPKLTLKLHAKLLIDQLVHELKNHRLQISLSCPTHQEHCDAIDLRWVLALQKNESAVSQLVGCSDHSLLRIDREVNRHRVVRAVDLPGNKGHAYSLDVVCVEDPAGRSLSRAGRMRAMRRVGTVRAVRTVGTMLRSQPAVGARQLENELCLLLGAVDDAVRHWSGRRNRCKCRKPERPGDGERRTDRDATKTALSRRRGK
jgi:hypothetical protein